MATPDSLKVVLKVRVLPYLPNNGACIINGQMTLTVNQVYAGSNPVLHPNSRGLMKIHDEIIINSLAEYYRNNMGGIDFQSDFIVDKFARVRKLLDALDGEGISDLDVIKIAAMAFEEQTIRDY